MRFWDSSALIPLIVSEPRSTDCVELIRSDPVVAYWWGSPIEIVSSLARRQREGLLSAADVAKARHAADSMLARGVEIAASDRVKLAAVQLLRLHPLRAADAMQLAAAQQIAQSMPASFEFVCLDDRLRLAATAEGATVLPMVL